MSGVEFRAETAAIITGTAVKTLLQVVAAANHRVKIHEMSVSFNGTSNTDAPILVEVLTQSTAGTMSALTLVKGNSSDDETLQTTGLHTATVEPTAGSVLKAEYVHPQTGFLWQALYGKEQIIPGGTRLGIRVTATVSVNAVARMEGEE